MNAVSNPMKAPQDLIHRYITHKVGGVITPTLLWCVTNDYVDQQPVIGKLIKEFRNYFPEFAHLTEADKLPNEIVRHDPKLISAVLDYQERIGNTNAGWHVRDYTIDDTFTGYSIENEITQIQTTQGIAVSFGSVATH